MRPTDVLAALAVLWLSCGPAAADSAAALSAAMRNAAAGDWAGAQAAADGPLTEAMVDWSRLRDGQGNASDYIAFLERFPDWPGLPLLRREGEAALADADPALVLRYFRDAPPETGDGVVALVRAHLASGNAAEAELAAIAAWRSLSMTASAEKLLLAQFGDRLADHHGGRMATLLAEGETTAARRLLPLVTPGTGAIAEARIALQTDAKGIDALIAAIPAELAGSAGLAHDRFRWRLDRGRDMEAASLVVEQSKSAESLGDPGWWADAREPLARRLMREGHPKTAYAIAARHHLTDGEDYAQLEWLAGYLALRKLDDPEAALAHFRRFRAAVTSPISLGRAGYWEGRAAEMLGRKDEAATAYAFAAEFQSGFYGQLAAEKLGVALDPALAGGVAIPDWRDAAFTRSTVFQAGHLLLDAGQRDLGERFLVHLAESLNRQELPLLAAYALSRERPHLALLIAKQAATRGIVLPRAYFPVTGLAEMDLPVPNELALSIARRESEFDPSVISGAGARGLMQVMPGTARLMARETGLSYDSGKLTADWRYNAKLGSAYLAHLRAEFGPSIALVAAGYNAGPGRPRAWMKTMGDPRNPNVDVIDWIEHVPFEETRNYIMRVAEAIPVYRARLAAGPVQIGLTDLLRGN
ncbi:MAG: lytic transglycosylase domain-containing protein [Paracoccaceae bacterium]